MKLLPKLENYIKGLDVNEIPETRIPVLLELRNYIQEKRAESQKVRLNFICTHNSRRSHLTMIWAATAAAYQGIEGIETLSGGTEATAFNPRAVKAIETAGFEVQNPGGDNPKYKVFFSQEAQPLVCFSKKFDDEANGKEPYAAVMTCSHADENCPFIPEADARIPVRYEDPKEFDDTPQETEMYDLRCWQIATEMLYVFQQLA
ncbi:protein-tyrosine-phosphatase [Jiulongibacter sediminis]|jgi:arsenate reductase|uniref:protein-tyrosine-phosphatase n=1 Tax=Jiulongibacter sediminis TaxID=1605367 RepID=UPI0026EAF1FB|nr:protein-tyrosine-phosphatase [Jiulongibacter sediminis]